MILPAVRPAAAAAAAAAPAVAAAAAAAPTVVAAAAAAAVANEDGKVADGLRTTVCGPHAQHVSDTLSSNGVRCAVLQNWDQFQQQMLNKLLWSSIFWLLSAGLGGMPVRLGMRLSLLHV
jgi:hypothetical protein